MKTKNILLSVCLLLLASNVFAQKQNATAAVREFYRFHLAHKDIFNEREVARRLRFLTPRLQKLFNAELQRQRLYLKKYPGNKPYFEGLPFTPIEFCPNDYSVGNGQIKGQTATVKVNFVYGKSSCQANDGTKIFYKISIKKIGGKWLIDDVVYDDGTTLTNAFNEAKKIK
jgi:hypothetical protein